jgi:hypothetical protein
LQLWPMHLAAASDGCLLNLSPEQDTHLKESLKQDLLTMVQQIFINAGDAVQAACSTGQPADVDMSPDGPRDVEAKEALQWERAIGSATAVTSQLSSSRVLTPALHEVSLLALPWAIQAQSLQNAELKGLTSTIRGLIVHLKNYMFEASDLPRVLEIGLSALESSTWQARGSALSLLQCLWFRCAPLSCVWVWR